MSAPDLSIPSPSLTGGLATGAHFPGAALLRDALADADVWLAQASDEHFREEDPRVVRERRALAAHVEAVSRAGE